MTTKLPGSSSALAQAGLPQHLTIAVLLGEMSIEDAAIEAERLQRIQALMIRRKADWPAPSMVWDLDHERWHLSMDDHDATSFAERFPDVALAWVEMDALHAALATVSRRVHDPLHRQYRSKTARLVTHLLEGGAVTPPFIIHDAGALVVVGGNHRLAWARHLNDAEVPVLFRQGSRNAIAARVPLRLGTTDYGFRSP